MPILPRIIAFQGFSGAYSDAACRAVYPDVQTLPCHSFDEAFAALADGRADLAMIPVDNTLAGRVADVHRLLPKRELFIIREHFQPIHHHLLGVKGAALADLKYVHSHVHAIPQCTKIIKRLGLSPRIHEDTAGAAQDIAAKGDKAHGAIASELAAQIYGLDILEREVQDENHNTTRFLVFAREPETPPITPDAPVLTSLIFEVRNIPAALYKALGGFATNGLSLAKLESYVDENFQAARFYCEVEGHPEADDFKHAIEELGFFARSVKFLGSYAAHGFRGR